uniref:F-box domain-containing protein n=1 Tax=Meloidogyne hapla TaxID=6305 RepID=A0A1I8AZQ9_MELHA
MFNNLPLESKLDIFKHLNIEQLTSVRQTNYYFNALIGRYEGELARKKFDKIVIYIETSKDNSNMVNYIKFTCYCWPTFNLSERAEFIRREQSFYGLIPSMFSHYQLSNIHNPKVKFSISYLECYELIYRFEIRRMS